MAAGTVQSEVRRDANTKVTVSKTDSTGTTTYTFNEENQLTQVTLPNGLVVNYKYDGLGRRIQRTTSAGANERYVYDGADALIDLNADWSVATTYLNGPGIDNHLRQTSSIAGVSYFLTNHLGSTDALTDVVGNVVEQLNYDSFGGGVGSAITRFGYTGRERDADTGMFYYRARFYDPQVGRFISEDPVRSNSNAYNYVENNPIRKRDPLGLFPMGLPFKPYPPFPDIWLHVEGGGGGQVIWGLNVAGGLILNLKTGEICAYVKGCARYGFGVIAEAGFKGGGAIFGPHCGKNAGGWQGGVVGELSSPEGGGSINLGYGGGWGGGMGIGPNWGIGFSLSGEGCYQYIIKCWRTPCECMQKQTK